MKRFRTVSTRHLTQLGVRWKLLDTLFMQANLDLNIGITIKQFISRVKWSLKFYTLFYGILSSYISSYEVSTYP